MNLKDRLDIYEQLMRLDKPIGILLLLWPTLWGLWLSAYGYPNPVVAVIFVLGVVLMRSAGCVVNDFADRNFDPHVERTRDRPLAAGRIGSAEALALAAALLLLALMLVLQLNRLTLELSVAALLLALIYPFLKRFFWMPQAWLGIAFGFGIPMAFAAHHNHVPAVAWFMMAANMFWSLAYDTEYAMADREDDKKLGLKSAAILFGRHDVTAVMVCYGLFIVMMLIVGWWMRLGVCYFIGATVAAALCYRQYELIYGRDRAACLRAFMSNHWIGAALFAGIVVDSLVRVPLPGR